MTRPYLTPLKARPLRRTLGSVGVLLLTISVATPASSVFVIIPGMLRTAGSGALIAMAIAAFVCAFMALIYAELSSAWPAAGGEYVVVAHTLGPATAFAVLSISASCNLLFPAVAALGVATVLGTVAPGLPEIPVALAVIAGSTITAALNIRINALVTGLFLVLEVLALAVVTLLGFLEPARPVAELLLSPTMPSPSGLVPATPAAIGVATSIAIFALNGYGMAVYFAEEMHDARRRIAAVIVVALGVTVLLEVLPLVAGLRGAADLRAFLTADDPFGALVASSGGRVFADGVAVGIAIAIINAIIAGIVATARLFFATGRDRSWGRPLDRLLIIIHPRLGSPVHATLLIGAVGAACCFIPLPFLLMASGAGLIVIYASMALALIVGRRTGATAHASCRMPLFPVGPLLSLIALAYVVWTNWLDVEGGRPALIATLVQLLLALTYYAAVLRRRLSWRPGSPNGALAALARERS